MKKIKQIWMLLMGIGFMTSCITERLDEDTAPRKSITFIMSQDKPGKSYFSLATEYFSQHPDAKTDVVSSECKTIECIIEQLNSVKHYKWSTINIVAHGNSKTGLNIYLSDEGYKATPKRIVQEVLLRNLPPLSRDAVDSLTDIQVYSCGIGTNPMIRMALPRIFYGSDSSPSVECSDKYIIFRPDANGAVQLLKASYWPYYFKRGYRPSISEIDAEMSRRYPTRQVDWAREMEDDKTSTMDYHIPISYTKVFEKSIDRPKFKSQEDKMNWVKTQSAISSQLEELALDYSDFHWNVDRRIITDEAGQRQYAVKAIGMSTVLCFLEIEE